MEDRRKAQKTAVLVLGAPRSGTSAISHVLSMLGVDFGKPDRFVDPTLNTHNPIFFELRSLNALNEQVIDWFGHKYSDFSFVPLREDFDAEILQRFLPLCEGLISDEFCGSNLIGLKDPRFCFVLPLWMAGLKRLGYRVRCVWVVRPLEAVIQSNERVNKDWVFEKNTRIAALSTMAAAYFLDGVDCIRVDYHKALTEPRQAAVRLGRWLERGSEDSLAATAASVLNTDLSQFKTKTIELPAPISQLSTDALDGLLSAERYSKITGFLRSIGFGSMEIMAATQEGLQREEGLHEKIEALKAMHGQTKHELEASGAREAQLHERLEASHREVENLRVAQVQTKRELEASGVREVQLRQQMIGLSERSSALENELRNSRESADRLADQLDEMQTNLACLNVELVEAKQHETRALHEAFWLSAKFVYAQTRVDEMVRKLVKETQARLVERESQAAQANELEARVLREAFWLSKKSVHGDERAASLNNALASLKKLHSANEARLDMLQASNAALQHELVDIKTSTVWRVLVRVRNILLWIPSPVRVRLRRGVKALWWLLTPWRLPERVRFLRARKSVARR